MGASNYACNIGLNRRITGGEPDSSWKLNGPNYVASSWDKTVNDTTDMATFQDGASNTAIFSEWIKGQAVPTGRPGTVWRRSTTSARIQTSSRPTASSRELCNTVPITSAQPAVAMEG